MFKEGPGKCLTHVAFMQKSFLGVIDHLLRWDDLNDERA